MVGMLERLDAPVYIDSDNPGLLVGEYKELIGWIAHARQGISMTKKLKKNRLKSYLYWCRQQTSSVTNIP